MELSYKILSSEAKQKLDPICLFPPYIMVPKNTRATEFGCASQYLKGPYHLNNFFDI